MRYVLRRLVLSETFEVPVDEGTYNKCKDSMNILKNAFEIEEKYELLISSYIDFERTLLEISNNYSIRSDDSYSDFFDNRILLNIKLINLLTTARLYLDQISSNAEACLSELADAKTVVKSYITHEFNNNLDYRFMEALRNYVQHRGLPVSSVKIGQSWIEANGEDMLETRVDLYAEKKELEHGDFKAKVLAEIGAETDLRKSTRLYLQSLSVIQNKIRELVNGNVNQARAYVIEMQDKYTQVSQAGVVGLAACVKADGIYTSKVPLIVEWDNIRIKLKTRNSNLQNLARRYISSKVK